MLKFYKIRSILITSIILATLISCAENKNQVELLNVSYDPTREFYRDFNAIFAKEWLAKEKQEVVIKQSHGGSAKQTRAVLDGLEADVVTLALAYDIDILHSKGNLVPQNWQSLLPHNSTPYTSTIVFLVRKGNPKNLKDWSDLVRDGVQIITPNPKTSGGARWNYLAAWGYAMRKPGGSQESAREFVRKLFANVPILDAGARGATTSFVQRGIGDVLLTWENEAFLAKAELGHDKFEIVVPSVSILAEPPVAVVRKNVDKKGNAKIAQAYLERLYEEDVQVLAAKHHFRPRSATALAKFPNKFPEIELFTIEEVFGGWSKAQKEHFDDGGEFDRIYGVK